MNAKSLTLSTFAMLAILLAPAAFAQPGTITTVAGNGYKGRLGIGGSATKAEMYGPSGVAFDKAGSLFLGDYTGEYIYEISTKGDLSIFAGSGAGGYSGDGGKAVDARFNQPVAIAFGPQNSLFIVDSNNNAIREINMSTNKIKTVAGNGAGAGPGNFDNCGTTVPGAEATKTPICNPQSVALDSKGNFYINNATAGAQILEVNGTTGVLTVVAGTGTWGYTGDGGQAVDAQLSWVEGIALDSNDNIYISDTGNCAIRKVTVSTGIITSLVGVPLYPWQGTCGLKGDGGPATAALVDDPWGLTVDQYGNIFFADEGNNLIRVISATGIMSTVAGSYTNGVGNNGYSGDRGPATKAYLSNPTGLTLDSKGDLYFVDGGNFVVRKVSQASPLP